jgi:hypothetical protein
MTQSDETSRDLLFIRGSDTSISTATTIVFDNWFKSQNMQIWIVGNDNEGKVPISYLVGRTTYRGLGLGVKTSPCPMDISHESATSYNNVCTMY